MNRLTKFIFFRSFNIIFSVLIFFGDSGNDSKLMNMNRHSRFDSLHINHFGEFKRCGEFRAHRMTLRFDNVCLYTKIRYECGTGFISLKRKH